ncbi:SirB1 family protein [Pseudomonas segetis]
MSPRQRCFACLDQNPPALLEAALWLAAEHDPALQPTETLAAFDELLHQVRTRLPVLPAAQLAMPLLRCLGDLDFHEDDSAPLRPQASLLHLVMRRRRGQPLALAIIALELAQRLDIPLQGVNFPGHFLVRVPGADHMLDPCSGRRLYTQDCRALLIRHFGSNRELHADNFTACDPPSMLQRMSRNLRHLHVQDDDYLAALKDAERVLLLGPPSAADHLARADIYQQLACPQAERFDVERALMLSEDGVTQLALGERLRRLAHAQPLH